MNDLKLAVETIRQLNISFGVAINRSDIGDDSVEKYCDAENIPIVLKIPFSRSVAEAYSDGIPLVSSNMEYIDEFRKAFKTCARIAGVVL